MLSPKSDSSLGLFWASFPTEFRVQQFHLLSSLQTLHFSLILAWQSSAIKMMPLRPSKSVLRSFHYQKYIAAGGRPFTCSSVAGTVSPHRFSAQKRNQSTATATAS